MNIKEIEGFKGYFVSDEGKIFSAHKRFKGISPNEMHEMKPHIINGYSYVGLNKERKTNSGFECA